MICKCPKCDGALEYMPASDKMECPFCGSSFTVQEVTAGQKKQDNVIKMEAPSASAATQFRPVERNDANMQGQAQVRQQEDQQGAMGGQPESTMTCNIYTCTSCGGELSVNGVEASTFCAYCGQPTIVFSRVSQEMMPKFILPFRIQKDQAVGAIREKLRKGIFVPNEIKNFEVEKVRGIYIPYWLFDVYYYDNQYLRGTVGSGKNKKIKYYIREADCDFKGLTCDASKILNDESSQRLEPYDLRGLKNFDVGYLSGFYSDQYDMKKEQLFGVAVERTKELFDEQVKKSVNASGVTIISNNPKYEIKRAEYAFLPAWFLTFRYKNEPYTMLVNGQTGKVVGAVPFAKAKLSAMFSTLAVIGTFIGTFISRAALMNPDSDSTSDIMKFFIVSAGIMALVGWGCFKKVKKNVELTKAHKTAKYVRERQDDN